MTKVKEGEVIGSDSIGSISEPFEKFDVADHLDSPEIVAEYLSAAFAEADPVVIADAIRTAARANGMAETASKAGLARESLYKALRPGSQPRLETIVKVLSALGFKLVVLPIGADLNVENCETSEISEDIGIQRSVIGD